ncbi:MAG TPA: APC family permease [Acidimicrobiales bacterium]|nr:APC family permease [Acidimicrobiales bacterium]
MVKRVMVGRPLASEEMDHQRIPKWIGLPVFSSDAISSTAYATEEILFVTALGASSLTLGLSKLVPIAMAVAVLLAIVTFSYRQTIFAYPNGGGSYMVSKEHLGEMPSLVAAASLLVDYVLVVAVSTSAGVAAIISIPTFQGLADQRVLLCLVLIAFVTIVNLRGMKESGKVFAFPTYIYIFSLGGMLAYGLFRSYFGDIEQVPFDPERFDGLRETGGSIGLFLLLRGFSSGAVALSGVEAISDGVPAFRKPQAKNAATTLLWMAAILGSLFFAVSVLAHHLKPYPTHEETVLSQMSRVVIGDGPFYWVLQFATAAILILAANTAYADFPRLSSFIARDGYLPRQFMNRGDRLVFSNGVVFLAIAAALLIVAFGGVTTALIPLYAIGVFTSFTLSQSGMVRRHLKKRQPGWRSATVISGVGAAATGIVALIVGITKFTIGAWVPIVVVPAIILIFKAIKRHYSALAVALALEPEEVRRHDLHHTVVVLVGRVHKGVVVALNYARSMRPDHLMALFVATDEEEAEKMQAEWKRFGFDVQLEIVHSRYRDLVEPVETYLDELDERWSNDTITIVIPEFVVGTKSLANLLHGQSALALKLALIDRPNTVVTSVPFHPTLPVAGAPSPPLGEAKSDTPLEGDVAPASEPKGTGPVIPALGVDSANGDRPGAVTPPREPPAQA